MVNPLDSDTRQRLDRKLAEIAAAAEDLPAVVIIHNIKTTTVEYMSPRGLRQLGLTLDQLREMGTAYHENYFNPEDLADYAPKIWGLLERNDDQEILSFFQQVRATPQDEWHWHFSTTKIFLRDQEGNPAYSITLASPVDPKHHITAKITKLLEENSFLRKNFQRFARLSTREKEVLRLVAFGKSSVEIAQDLFISETTVNTHRRNIKMKLDTHSSFELAQYARAFDLI
ncbi:MAG: helix-turn-helix domain-containing protein [Rufibacter sp.]